MEIMKDCSSDKCESWSFINTITQLLSIWQNGAMTCKTTFLQANRLLWSTPSSHMDIKSTHSKIWGFTNLRWSWTEYSLLPRVFHQQPDHWKAVGPPLLVIPTRKGFHNASYTRSAVLTSPKTWLIACVISPSIGSVSVEVNSAQGFWLQQMTVFPLRRLNSSIRVLTCLHLRADAVCAPFLKTVVTSTRRWVAPLR